jgi:drug/metabolite transporter (DMT)-like permease
LSTYYRLDWRLALLLTVPPLTWAGNAVIGRYAGDLISPLLLNLLRWAGAGLLLAPLGWRIFQAADSRQRIRSHAGYLIVLALLGVGVFNALQYTALKTTTAINVVLILSSAPVFGVLIGLVFYRQPVRPAELLSVALSLLGVAVVLTRGELSALTQLRLAPGDLVMLAGTVGWSIYTWMLSRPPATLRPEGSTPWNWAEYLLLQIAIGAVWAGLFAGGQVAGSPQAFSDTRWGWPLALVLIYVIVFPSLVAYRCWGLGVARAGPTLTMIFANLNPLFAALLSALWLREPPGWHHGVAFLLIVGGIAISTLARNRAPPPAPTFKASSAETKG